MLNDQLLSSYDYDLPAELIAQTPAIPRDSSRLLVVNADLGHTHSIFQALPQWLEKGDLLVLNNTRVIPARLYGRKATGAPIQILLLEQKQENCWLSLVKPGKRFKIGAELLFYPPSSPETSEGILLKAKVIDRDEATGGRILEFYPPENGSFWDVLDQIGQIPFPPYVTSLEANPSQYQTVYAEEPGAVAAPTAGLHFTDELLGRLKDQGIEQTYITLHVGIGTFRPVEVENITEHTMHTEWLEVPLETVEKIEQTKARGGRVIAVGTTVVRALEGAAKESNPPPDRYVLPFQGKTDIFIYPGYQWRVIDGMITNFHLPRSSLLMLVSALIGRERLFKLYQEAIEKNYRFYSFGDAMLILPASKTGQLPQN